MDDNIVKLVFNAGSTGFEKVIGQTQTLQGKLGKLAQGASILGSAFGQVGGSIGRAFGMFLQGGVWGAAAELVKLLVEKTGILKKTVDETAKTYESLNEKISKSYDDALARIDKVCRAKNTELDVNQKLIESEIRLKKARGDISADEAESRITESRSKTTAAKSENLIRLGEDAQNVRKATVDKMKKELSRLGDILGSFERQATDKMSAQRMKFMTESDIEVRNTRGTEELAESFIEEAVRRKTDKKMREWISENGESELYGKEIASLVKSINETYSGMREVEEAIKTAEDERALQIKRERTESNNVIAEAGEKRKAEELAILQAQASALKVKSPSQSVGGSFSEHFELWRDAEAAQAAQDAAKKRSGDLNEFYKSVNRYGGRWRINEAANLMRTGDEAGLQTRLEEWRKSSTFNGKTEQMVLAAAAKKAESSREKDISDIAKASGEINAKLDAIKSAFEGGDE